MNCVYGCKKRTLLLNINNLVVAFALFVETIMVFIDLRSFSVDESTLPSRFQN